ncbi:MAG: SCO family protein [Novosphingobium sp.]|uniref:SCO family protein n=1 Tax=Novosphingobium sp. TaxID=1874826 RepID=UPI00273565F8|nr:SCO family protein [Novosphingobium sp.]MDP3548960.1 SCO family protein [Novosphingobium sp.]
MGGNGDGNSGGSWTGVAKALLPGIAVPAVLFALVTAFMMLATGSTQPVQPQSDVNADGRYRLVTPWNSMFDRAMLKGHPYIVWYGCTECADGSAKVLGRMVRLRNALGPAGKDLRILMITLDPQRDTPERLRGFVNAIDGGVIALTGNAEVIARVADNAGVFVRRTRMAGGELRIEHTSGAYLYDANDEFFGTIGTKESDAEAAAKLRGAIAVGDGPKALIQTGLHTE